MQNRENQHEVFTSASDENFVLEKYENLLTEIDLICFDVHEQWVAV